MPSNATTRKARVGTVRCRGPRAMGHRRPALCGCRGRPGFKPLGPPTRPPRPVVRCSSTGSPAPIRSASPACGGNRRGADGRKRPRTAARRWDGGFIRAAAWVARGAGQGRARGRPWRRDAAWMAATGGRMPCSRQGWRRHVLGQDGPASATSRPAWNAGEACWGTMAPPLVTFGSHGMLRFFLPLRCQFLHGAHDVREDEEGYCRQEV